MKESVHPAVKQALRKVKQRLRIFHAVQGGALGVLAAFAGCAVLAAVSYFIPIPGLFLLMLTTAAGLFALAVLIGLLWPVSYGLAARRADAGGLHERAITALALQADTPMAHLQREDAIRHLHTLALKDAVPLRPKKHPLIAAWAIALLTLAALIWIPNPQFDVLARREAFQKAMATQAETVEEAAEKLEDSAYTKEELNALRKLMGDLARELRNAMEPQQAYLAVDKAQQPLEDMQKNASDRMRQSAAQAFAQSGLKNLSDALSKSDAQAASQAVEQLKESGAQEMSSEAFSQASSVLPEGALKEAAAQTADAMKAGDAQSLNAALNTLDSAMQSACSGSNPGASGNSGDLGALMAQLRAGTLSASQGNAGGLAAGAGQGTGSGTGQGTGAGQGGMVKGAGSGAGKGSTNQDAGVSKAGTGSMGEGSGPPEYKLGQYETIYDPTRLSGADDIHAAAGAVGEGESQQLQLGPGLGDASGQVPYHEVIFAYQEAASRAAQQESLPEGMRLWVDGYFQALIE